jgi:hypothetical protein
MPKFVALWHWHPRDLDTLTVDEFDRLCRLADETLNGGGDGR